ncbi:hypothetical protein BET10_14850 [Pseudoalteromonas amylolytica]|uniref:Uncharacterized protein n=1 Tax=Pseudoalteromonas amylolytica TaxID=1859457 RepID=A0A1S1MT77_9GAMM|nr:hypothetical protein BFC16_20125 [Pseudoalteromonas sp. JW3]OHU90052.1 hypothetical protein BET10_14850 [Pseudoalteromonas amylolytica]
MEPNKISILPLVIDDCKLPLFLRSKLYADFRQDFNSGLDMIVDAVRDMYNLYSGAITNEDKKTSFSSDISTCKNSVEINMDVISEDDDSDYFILSKIKFVGNEVALGKYLKYKKDGKSQEFVKLVTKALGSTPEISKARMIITGREGGSLSFEVADDSNLSFAIKVESKKVGPDNGKVVLFNLGEIFNFHQELA